MSIRSYMTVASIDQIIKTTSAFRLLSDPTRCKMILLLSKRKDGMCVYEIAEAIGISHSAISHQLAKLEMKEIVAPIRQGKEICYQLNGTSFVRNILHVMKIFNP